MDLKCNNFKGINVALLRCKTDTFDPGSFNFGFATTGLITESVDLTSYHNGTAKGGGALSTETLSS